MENKTNAPSRQKRQEHSSKIYGMCCCFPRDGSHVFHVYFAGFVFDALHCPNAAYLKGKHFSSWFSGNFQNRKTMFYLRELLQNNQKLTMSAASTCQLQERFIKAIGVNSQMSIHLNKAFLTDIYIFVSSTVL